MTAGDLVTAVSADEEERLIHQPRAECGQKVERRRISPVQVVEKNNCGSSPPDRPQRAPHRLEHRRAITASRPPAELREQDAQVSQQRTTVVKSAWLDPEESPQRRRYGRIRWRCLLGRIPSNEQHPVDPQRIFDKTRFPDTRLTTDEHKPASPRPRPCKRTPKRSALPLTANQRALL